MAAQAIPYPHPNQKNAKKGNCCKNITGNKITATRTRIAAKNIQTLLNRQFTIGIFTICNALQLPSNLIPIATLIQSIENELA